ncbi:MAG TPA: NAD-dependent epimerase/dehydratase family protein, partial [Gemmatimonadaceae bacterium]|nr:NAD-dependent epimerase/dehydratase family protein [Gemmatimonadaceae bacterium]
QALAGDDITIYGDGRQTRSFCYVSDLVDGLLRLMACDTDPQGAINLGNPAEITVAAFADEVLAMTGSEARITYRPLPVDDPRRRRPDIARARALLGWTPSVPLSEGLARTIAWFARTHRPSLDSQPSSRAMHGGELEAEERI